MPRNVDETLPRTLQRSPAKAQRTYKKALASAHEQYGSEERAHRVALAALKRSFEKVGDHWEAKAQPGPYDSRARQGRGGGGRSAGGVDVVGHTRAELLERARDLGVRGRSRMNKEELGRAIARSQSRATRRSGTGPGRRS